MEFSTDEDPTISFDSDEIDKKDSLDHPLSSPNLGKTPPQPLPNTNMISNVCGGKETPYRIVHLIDLISMVNNNLAKCSECTNHRLTLKEESSAGFAVNLVLQCDHCEQKKNKVYRQWKYLEKKVNDKNKCVYKNEKLARKKQQQQIWNKKVQYTKLQQKSLQKYLHNHIVGGSISNHFIRHKSLSHEINIRFMLSPFYLGCGGYDISCIMSLVGIDHAMSFYQTFHRYSKEVESTLRKVTENYLDEAISNELYAIIKEQDGNRYSNTELNDIKTMISKKEYEIRINVQEVRHMTF